MSSSTERRVPDHESDPAHNTEVGQEWADEGGASHLGPATHTRAADPEGDEATDASAE